jgi:hypothetical protein
MRTGMVARRAESHGTGTAEVGFLKALRFARFSHALEYCGCPHHCRGIRQCPLRALERSGRSTDRVTGAGSDVPETSARHGNCFARSDCPDDQQIGDRAGATGTVSAADGQ